MNREIFDDADALARAVARALADRLTSIQSEGRTPTLVLTGGTIANRVYEHLEADATDWHAVDYYWGDERFVPADHAESNAHQARQAFLDRLGVPADRIHVLPPHSCDYGMGEAADRYATQLPESFDLVLLGVGDDGHIASLFPGHASLDVTDRDVIAEFASPKPPPQRLSLTLPALNRAGHVWFIVSGTDKATAVERAWSGDAVRRTPAAGVRGSEETRWFLDAAAAAAL